MNEIKVFVDHNGQWEVDRNRMTNIISDYFMTLFSSYSPTNFDIYQVTQHVQIRVFDQMNRELSKWFSEGEIQLTISQIYPNKSPRPHGISGAFF